MWHVRTQSDNRGDEYSLLARTSFKGAKDMARQEQKDDTDINIMLRKFGVNVPQKSGAHYGEWDESLDLQTAYAVVDEAVRGYRSLPLELRNRYASMQAFLNAYYSGELAWYLEEEKKSALEREKTAAQAAAPAGAPPPHDKRAESPKPAEPAKTAG